MLDGILSALQEFVTKGLRDATLPIPRLCDRVVGGVKEGADPVYADIMVHRGLEGKTIATVRLNTDEFTPDNVEIVAAVVRHANDHAQMLIRKFNLIYDVPSQDDIPVLNPDPIDDKT